MELVSGNMARESLHSVALVFFLSYLFLARTGGGGRILSVEYHIPALGGEMLALEYGRE
jgi:hypothetical protein